MCLIFNIIAEISYYLMEVNALISEIKTLTILIKKEFVPLSEEQLNLKPTPDTWSIAQVLDHLIVTNTSYFPVIANVAKNENHLPWYSGIKIVPLFFGKILLKAVHPDNRKK